MHAPPAMDHVLGAQRVAPRSPSLASLARRALGALALAGIPALGLVIATSAATHRSRLTPGLHTDFNPSLRGPFQGLGEEMTSSRLLWLVLAMIACWVAVLALCRAIGPRLMIGGIVLSNLVVAVAPPLLSADVFGYLDFARMGALHHLDPYTHMSGSVLSDPIRHYVRWRHMTTPYGPLFTLGSYALAPLSIAAGLWSLKALAAAASVALAWVAWRAAQRLGRPPLAAAAFVGLNPVLLVYGVGGAHNDLLVVLVVMAGVLLAVVERERMGGLAVLAGAGLKASAGVVLPFLVAGSARPRRAIEGALLGVAALAVIALPVFGVHALSFIGVIGHQQHIVAVHSVPNELGRLLGRGGATPKVRLAGVALAAGVGAFQLWRTWRGGDWIRGAGWTTLAVLVGSSWLLPWYVVWLLPLAALAPDRRLRVATVAFSVFVVGARLPMFAG